jgi:hypothetical protein
LERKQGWKVERRENMEEKWDFHLFGLGKKTKKK